MDLGIPVTIGSWIIAVIPIALLLVLMMAFDWGVAEAGAIGWISAAVIAGTYFQLPLDAIGYGSVHGTWGSFSVLYVVWTSILLYEITRHANAYEPLRRWMTRIMPDQLSQVLAFGWAFASFLMGVTGFGVPIAVVAPLLVGMGVRPVYAVVVPLVGLAWNNTFGTLAVAWLALMQVTNLTPAQTAMTALLASIFIWIVALAGGLMVCWIYNGMKGVKHGLPQILIGSTVQGVVTLVVSQWNPVLAGFLAGTAGFIAFFFVARLPRYDGSADQTSRIFQPGMSQHERGPEGEPAGSAGSGGATAASSTPAGTQAMSAQATAAPSTSAGARTMSVMESLSPYYILLILILGVFLISPIREAFSAITWGISFPALTSGLGYSSPASSASFTPLTHPGTFLLVASIISYAVFRSKRRFSEGAGSKILMNMVEKSIPSTIAVVALIAMSGVMSASGMISVLAFGVGNVTGGAYAFLAPFVGGIGAFVTTSNMASNLLFGAFTQQTAIATGLSAAALLAAQTAGAAAGNMIAPGNVVLGTTTAGILGKEGSALRLTMVPFLLASAAIGVAAIIVSLVIL